MSGLARVIDRNSTTVTYIPLEGTTNEGGHAEHQFGTPQQIEASIRPGSTADFEIGSMGQSDARTKVMFVRNEHGVETDDRIQYTGDDWHVTERQVGTRGDFSRFILTEDSRSTTGESDTGSEGPDNSSGDSDGGGSGDTIIS